MHKFWSPEKSAVLVVSFFPAVGTSLPTLPLLFPFSCTYLYLYICTQPPILFLFFFVSINIPQILLAPLFVLGRDKPLQLRKAPAGWFSVSRALMISRGTLKAPLCVGPVTVLISQLRNVRLGESSPLKVTQLITRRVCTPELSAEAAGRPGNWQARAHGGTLGPQSWGLMHLWRCQEKKVQKIDSKMCGSVNECTYVSQRERELTETDGGRESRSEWIWLVLRTGSLRLRLSGLFLLFLLDSFHFWQWNSSPHFHFLHVNSFRFKSIHRSLNRYPSACLQWFSLDRGISGD